MTKDKKTYSLTNEEIQHYIPHRYPFLLVDRIEDLIPCERATGIKNVTINEPCFTGHFPGRPVFPGVLMIEALAQTAAICVHHGLMNQNEPEKWKYTFLGAVDNARFRNVVTPGDQLLLKVTKRFHRRFICAYHGEVIIRDSQKVAAEADLTAILSNNKS